MPYHISIPEKESDFIKDLFGTSLHEDFLSEESYDAFMKQYNMNLIGAIPFIKDNLLVVSPAGISIALDVTEQYAELLNERLTQSGESHEIRYDTLEILLSVNKRLRALKTYHDAQNHKVETIGLLQSTE